MSNGSKSRVQSFYRIVKAQHGHQFAGLYAVEKVMYRDGAPYSRQIVHEWDLRIITEAKLAQLGGQDAYESFKVDHDDVDLALAPETSEIMARKPEDVELSKRKLSKELKFKPEAE